MLKFGNYGKKSPKKPFLVIFAHFDPDHPTLGRHKKSTAWIWEVDEPIIEPPYKVLSLITKNSKI